MKRMRDLVDEGEVSLSADQKARLDKLAQLDYDHDGKEKEEDEEYCDDDGKDIAEDEDECDDHGKNKDVDHDDNDDDDDGSWSLTTTLDR